MNIFFSKLNYPTMTPTQEAMILASGLNLRISASYLVPDAVSQKPLVIIMGGFKSAGLLPLAESVAAAELAAVMSDYLYFRDSEGELANLVSILPAIVGFPRRAWARRQDCLWDTAQVVIWGSSFGGMHITSLMADDHDLAAGIMQCHCVDGLAAARMNPQHML